MYNNLYRDVDLEYLMKVVGLPKTRAYYLMEQLPTEKIGNKKVIRRSDWNAYCEEMLVNSGLLKILTYHEYLNPDTTINFAKHI